MLYVKKLNSGWFVFYRFMGRLYCNGPFSTKDKAEASATCSWCIKVQETHLEREGKMIRSYPRYSTIKQEQERMISQ